MAKDRVRLLVFNDPHAMRIDSRLAKEIGFEESVVFLQLEYLIGVSQHEREGHLWTFQSLRTLNKEQFPWWSTAKLLRIIKRLEERELILIGNFNKTEWDKTQWFALNEVGIGRLKSVSLAVDPFQNETPTRFKMKHRLEQNETGLFQNETTIPKTTPKTTTEVRESAPAPIEPDPIPDNSYNQQKMNIGKDPKPDPDGNAHHPMVVLTQQKLGRTLNINERGHIVDKIQNEQCWRDTLDYWVLNGYPIIRLGTMFDRYKEQLPKYTHTNRPQLSDGRPDYEAINRNLRTKRTPV